METSNKKMNAIHEKDLNKLLEKFNLIDDFINGKAKCKFCQSLVSKHNIYSLLPESGMVNIICDNSECVSALLEYISQINKTKQEK